MYQRLAAYFAGEGVPLFAILDGARDRTISRMVRTSGFEHQSLYEGEAGEELAPFGPYLVTLPDDPTVLEPWFAKTWGKSFGVLLASREPFAAVRRHLRRFLKVEMEDGREVYFRYYDPRVLRRFLPTCTYEEWMQFFGVIESYFMESEDGTSVLRFRCEADEPEAERVSLSSSPGEARGVA